MKYVKYLIVILGLFFILLLSYSVSAEWHSQSFGGSVTVEPWINSAPTFSDNSPSGSGIELNVNLSVVVTDANGNESTVYWKIDTDSNVNDTSVAHINTSILNETAYYNYSSEVDSYSTTYYVGVWANDTHDNSSIYWSFTTVNQPEPYVYDESPTNGSTDEVTTGITLSINVTEYQGQKFNITWSTNASAWTAYNSSCDNGTFTQDITWADTESTKYWWNVSVNDTAGNWNNKTYHFTTGSFEWGNWSVYWKLGQTSIYDVNLNMGVNIVDVTSVTSHYGESGDPGWIDQDINNDGDINYIDVSGIANHFGEDYT